MELNIIEIKGVAIAKPATELRLINTVDDALDLIGNAGYLGALSVILHESNLAPEFFDLKTRFAGEVLQKFSNYNMRLAIAGDFDKFSSSALKDFIKESNRTGRVIFVKDEDEAKAKLLGG